MTPIRAAGYLDVVFRFEVTVESGAATRFHGYARFHGHARYLQTPREIELNVFIVFKFVIVLVMVVSGDKPNSQTQK